jgi:bifunctional DNA-binding transcriptional regulator/antitoxin component of YhaV-PrlF toxin-antitoxin module
MNLTAFQEDPNQIREALGLSVYDVLERINEEEKTLARIRKGQ